jgi:hypothetical protein
MIDRIRNLIDIPTFVSLVCDVVTSFENVHICPVQVANDDCIVHPGTQLPYYMALIIITYNEF